MPSRGLIGFTLCLSACGTGVTNAVLDGYQPWAGEIQARQEESGTLIFDRTDAITPFVLLQLADWGQFFV